MQLPPSGRGVQPTSQNPYLIYDQNLRFLLPFVVYIVSFAAVFRLVTQRSSPQTAAFFRTTFLSLCFSVQAIDQSYHNDCLQSNQSNCSKKTFPQICEFGMLISANLFVVFTAQYLSWDSPTFSWIRDVGKQNTRGNVSKISVSLAWTHWANSCLFCEKICHQLP